MGTSQAILVGSFVVSVVWGFHIISLGFCMHALFTTSISRSTKKINWRMVAVAWVLFANATFDMTLSFRHVFHAFLSTTSEEAAEAAYAISDWSNLARTISVVLQTIIGDAVLIYRCWIVYQRSILVVLPSLLLWFGLVGSTIWALILEAMLNVLFNARQVTHAITTFWSITIALNTITTGLLVYRIWSVDHTNRKHHLEVIEFAGQGRLKSIKNIIIESGLLYTLSAIATFGTYVGGSGYVYLTSWVEVQVVGIAFNLIIIRTTFLCKRDSSMSWKVSPESGGLGENHTIPLQFVSASQELGHTCSMTEIFISSSVVMEIEQPNGSKVEVDMNRDSP
ncbi:hypothetical protein BDN70DRAFT_885758 [Pholiota conissans]|uniref:Uncharacterized protein n=1 Tax=Pholiota conissans TaxID=109636 RepID=A0A9P5YT78_9AGAR|nr:hypothetical protein BDN70DRAFT_885758 [Pholiota conissans]